MGSFFTEQFSVKHVEVAVSVFLTEVKITNGEASITIPKDQFVALMESCLAGIEATSGDSES